MVDKWIIALLCVSMLFIGGVAVRKYGQFSHDSPRLYGLDAQSSPPPGSLAPGPNTIPPDLAAGLSQKVYHRDDYWLDYELGSKSPGKEYLPEQITIGENFGETYRPIELMGINEARDREIFQFSGYPGYILDIRNNKTDHFELAWDDAGTPLKITLSNIPIGKYSSSSIIDLLKTMQRIAGDSPRGDFIQPPNRSSGSQHSIDSSRF